KGNCKYQGGNVTKKIEAIIREERLNDVKDALRKIGIVGMNITTVRGYGRNQGIVLEGKVGTSQADLEPRVQFNIVLSDHNVDRAVDAISKAGSTSAPGNGLIFVYPVDDVIRIRTGERGHEALMYSGDIDEQREQALQAELVGIVSGPLLPEP
ncbi:MAG: P-II family nitrogen regulator, partial [Chloroflexi bacterium]|nr:P-II family nitrogen regulator [Chloroflexota bacterium]